MTTFVGAQRVGCHCAGGGGGCGTCTPLVICAFFVPPQLALQHLAGAGRWCRQLQATAVVPACLGLANSARRHATRAFPPSRPSLVPPHAQGRAMDGLKILKRSRVTMKLLADTQSGKRVKALTKHPKPELAAAAAGVVAAWKEVVKQEASAGGGPPAAAASGATSAASGGAGSSKAGGGLARAASQATVEHAPSSQLIGATISPAPGSQAAAAPPLDLSAVPRCGDSIRDKCRQNLAAAMNIAVGGWGLGVGPGVPARLGDTTSQRLAVGDVT